MKNERAFYAYLLIGFGIYFLIKQLNLAIFNNFYSWTTALIIIGIAFLMYSYLYNDNNNIFPGMIILGLGIHLHGLENYHFWVDHWSVYLFIAGFAFIIRYFKTKTGLFSGVLLCSFAFLMFFSIKIPKSLQWIYGAIDFINTFWPVALIALGLYLLKFKK